MTFKKINMAKTILPRHFTPYWISLLSILLKVELHWALSVFFFFLPIENAFDYKFVMSIYTSFLEGFLYTAEHIDN